MYMFFRTDTQALRTGRQQNDTARQGKDALNSETYREVPSERLGVKAGVLEK